jgi:hypothetical protein
MIDHRGHHDHADDAEGSTSRAAGRSLAPNKSGVGILWSVQCAIAGADFSRRRVRMLSIPVTGNSICIVVVKPNANTMALSSFAIVSSLHGNMVRFVVAGVLFLSRVL